MVATEVLGLGRPLTSRSGGLGVNTQGPVATTLGVLLAGARHVTRGVGERFALVVLEAVTTVTFPTVLHTSHAEAFLDTEVQALGDGKGFARHGASVQRTVATVCRTTSGGPSGRNGDGRRAVCT